MSNVKIGSTIRNNESGTEYAVVAVVHDRATYRNATGRPVSVRLDRIHEDGKVRHRNYNLVTAPAVVDEPAPTTAVGRDPFVS